jgi:broad specificity phosphatase PhoE
MKSIRFLRHAESAANAGLPTSDPGGIPLTEKGKRAAQRAALEYDGPAPDLIVVSPFLWAKQTAEPFIARFPAAKVETTWPVQEFTYISPERCVGSTFEKRKPIVEAY